MTKKFFLTLVSVFVFFILANQSAFASKLPDVLWSYIKTEIPNATQRFDSVIALPNDVLYIPLYPAQKNDVTPIQIEYTYPKSLILNSLPEVVVFNNNYVLLKVFKNAKGKYTITTNENLPSKVRLGIMPQDMLVPVDLIVPESLKLVLGDLEIPQKSDDTLLVGDVSAVDKDTKKSGNFVPLTELSGKKYFVSTNSSKFVYVYDNSAKEPLYELKLNSLPSKILASNNTKFALVFYFSNKTLEVVDLKNERVMGRIELAGSPKDAEMDYVNDLVYVTSAETNHIYVIDLKSGKLAKEILVEQAPSKIGISESGKTLAFVDYKTNELYAMRLNTEEYLARYIDKINNLSKIIVDDENVYTISRAENKLNVYNIDTAKLIDEQRTSKKPVDALKVDNMLYILCAKEGLLDVYDMSVRKITKVVSLDRSGFYSRITKIPNQKNALITGIRANKFILFNLKDAEVVKKQPFDLDVVNFVLIDK